MVANDAVVYELWKTGWSGHPVITDEQHPTMQNTEIGWRVHPLSTENISWKHTHYSTNNRTSQHFPELVATSITWGKAYCEHNPFIQHFNTQQLAILLPWTDRGERGATPFSLNQTVSSRGTSCFYPEARGLWRMLPALYSIPGGFIPPRTRIIM